jgi:hypothetical protein
VRAGDGARHHGSRARRRTLPLLLALAIAPAALSEPARTLPPRVPPPLLEGILRGGRVEARASVPPGSDTDPFRQEILRTLQEGLRAGIVFQIRLYAPTRGLAALLGDELLAEVTIARTAQWDRFMRQYVVEETVNGEERELWTGSAPSDLLRVLLEVEPVLLFDEAAPPPAGSYLTALYRLSPVQIDGPLWMVTLLYDVGARTSPRARAPLGEAP